MKKNVFGMFVVCISLILLQACNLPLPAGEEAPASLPTSSPAPVVEVPPTSTELATEAAVQHQVYPASIPNAELFFDVESSGTAPERRAPYGDSYDINRLERPFTQDMTYMPDLDIDNFSLSQDAEWFYISIALIGGNPNHPLGIHYGVEFDVDRDGFGDYVVVAAPPYEEEWTTSNVRVLADKNRNTSGISPSRSDAPFTTDGYETLIFDGNSTANEDPDLAWVRYSSGANAVIQFALKRPLVGDVFMFGVFADAGIRDMAQLDYVDRFTEAEAGSPVRSNLQYPLKAFHSFDNTCREAVGFKPSGFEPMICPEEPPPTPEPRQPSSTQSAGCTNPGAYTDQVGCEAAGCAWVRNPNVLVAVVYYCTYP